MILTDEQRAKALEAFNSYHHGRESSSVLDEWLRSWELAIEYATQAAYERPVSEEMKNAGGEVILDFMDRGKGSGLTAGDWAEGVFIAMRRTLAKESQASGKGEKG